MKHLEKTILVIFGITGDLAQRKLLPSLYRLTKAGLIPESFHILGISRKGTQNADIIQLIKKSIPHEEVLTAEQILSKIDKMLTIVDMNISDPDNYQKLVEALAKIETKEKMNRLFYLAIPATLFSIVTNRLGKSDLNKNEKGVQESRFLIEKPFGYNMESAQALISELAKQFSEEQIYRIDHYLAKETAQNILAFRFENPLFCQTWNNKHISHIMITASEEIGIEGRALFYENMGALRDLVQSHLLQLLALVTMNKPSTLTDEEIHIEKEKILSCIMPPEESKMISETVRGQYQSYRDETNNPTSMTETYAAVRLRIDNDEWSGVPIFIRTGKSLKAKMTEVTIVFSACKESIEKANLLTIRIQPNEGIVIDLRIKKPGFDTGFEDVQLDFCYFDKLQTNHPDAYERVLVDAMRGDRTLFASSQEVLECWRITEPILTAWKNPSFPLFQYTNNSWGPNEANIMIEESGIKWLTDTHAVCSIPRIRTKP